MQHYHQAAAAAAKLATAPTLQRCFLIVCAPAIAVAVGVFIASMAERGGSMAVVAAAVAMPASVVLPMRCLLLLPLPPPGRQWQSLPAVGGPQKLLFQSRVTKK